MSNLGPVWALPGTRWTWRAAARWPSSDWAPWGSRWSKAPKIGGKAMETMGKPWENHGKTMGKWWFHHLSPRKIWWFWEILMGCIAEDVWICRRWLAFDLMENPLPRESMAIYVFQSCSFYQGWQSLYHPLSIGGYLWNIPMPHDIQIMVG